MTILYNGSQTLLGQVRDIMQTSEMINDLSLTGSDGTVTCPTLLLAAISPILQNEEQYQLLMPDFNVYQIENFVSQLTSAKEPSYATDFQSFKDILYCLGYKNDIYEHKQLIGDLKQDCFDGSDPFQVGILEESNNSSSEIEIDISDQDFQA